VTGDATEKAKFQGFFFRIELPPTIPFPDRMSVTQSGVTWWIMKLITVYWPGEEHILPAMEHGDQIQLIRDMFVLVHSSVRGIRFLHTDILTYSLHTVSVAQV
jgi:hypothetical protein